VGLAACDESSTIRVKLQARPLPQEPTTYMQIEAQVAGPTEGLQYRWFAAAGTCEPQESDEAKTIYNFPDGVRQDQVSLEIWKNNRRLAQSQIKLKYTADETGHQNTHPPDVQIHITMIPPAEPGGENTHADIAGTVSGKISPSYAVVIYARAAGAWFIQPIARDMHIVTNNCWATWTHTGTRYAALLVRPDYEPLTTLDMMPKTNNYVLAIDVVDGIYKQQPTNTTLNSTVAMPPEIPTQ
jgi:hypothetical protein